MFIHVIDDEITLQQGFQEALEAAMPQMIANCHRNLLHRFRTCVEQEGGDIRNLIH